MNGGCGLKTLAQSFELALRAQNKSPRTLEAYGAAIAILHAWLWENNRPTALATIKRDDINAFVAGLLAKGNKPATASNRFLAPKTLFRWAVDEGEIEYSPMAQMKGPSIPETPPPILRRRA